jgi:hypothetical protein
MEPVAFAAGAAAQPASQPSHASQPASWPITRTRAPAQPPRAQVLGQEGDCYCVVLHALLDDNVSGTPAQEPQAYPGLEALATRLGSRTDLASAARTPGVTSPAAPAAAAARAGGEAWQAVDLGGAASSASASPKGVAGDALSRRLQQQLQVGGGGGGAAHHSRTSSLGSSDTWHIATRKKTLFAGG